MTGMAWGLAALLSVVTQAEPTRCQVQSCPKDLADTRHSVRYADGSGNQWVLQAGTVEYVPVRPEQSSSGMYSGGAPWKAALSAAQYAEIAQAIDRAIATKEAHAARREKMTGAIELRCGEEKASFIIAPRRPELRAIEQALAKARPGK